MSEQTLPISKTIATAYNVFLESKGVDARAGQKRMMNLCYSLINSITVDSEGKRQGEEAVCVIEAGTGTGKTLGYSIPLIPLAKSRDKYLVIATATIALQEQVAYKDLPDIRACAGLDFTYAVAKGRGRYFCKMRASREADREVNLYGAESYELKTIRDEFDNSLWDGDRDSYPDEIKDAFWHKVNAITGQCPAQNCPHYVTCPFYKARRELDDADVIVANHDIVLADLSLGGGVVLPDPSESIYVFDEGHHIPSKAINHFASSSSLDATQKWLDEIFELSMPLVDAYNEEMENHISNLYTDAGHLKRQLAQMKDFILRNVPFKPEYQGREICVFPNGQTPLELINSAKLILQHIRDIQLSVAGMSKLVEEQSSGAPENAEHRMITGELTSRFEAVNTAWHQLVNIEGTDKNGIPFARWIAVERDRKNEVIINTSPVHAGEMLKAYVWSRVHAAVITSATLRSMGTFDSFIDKAGLTAQAQTLHVQSPFRYEEQAVLYIPKMHFSPKDADGHTIEVGSMLPKLVGRLNGCLVLFASKRQMTEVHNLLNEDLQSVILMQGTLPKTEIIARHKCRIDKGDLSIIFGMASFAEGVDLPGNYCNNVIIAKLPFTVPTDPVGQTLAGWMESVGRNTFVEISVPDACMKLIQAVGRLIRTEADTGAVTILDNRLVRKGYGQGILDSLPPFRRVIR
ncbi:ATP-dependent DNA helicase DinG [Cronobacter turicensis]